MPCIPYIPFQNRLCGPLSLPWLQHRDSAAPTCEDIGALRGCERYENAADVFVSSRV